MSEIIINRFAEHRRRLAEMADALVPEGEDREQFMDRIRSFKEQEEKHWATEEAEGRLDFEEMLVALSALAEAILLQAYQFERCELRKSMGTPSSPLYVIAMGKFGGCEMTLQSDLDLIFIFREHGETSGERVLTNQEFFVRLVQRIISNLSTLTRRGRAYSVDTELRPSGRAGLLVSSWSAFQEYQAREARTWEKQALLKARPIDNGEEGWEEMADRLSEQIWNRSYGPEIASEIHHLRERLEREVAKEEPGVYNIKVGMGGIVDIEFATQYLQLRYGKEQPGILSPHTLSSLRSMIDIGLLEKKRAEPMIDAYLFYRRLETVLRSIARRSSDRFMRPAGAKADALAERLGEENFELLWKKCETYRRLVRQSYKLILELT